MMEFLETLAEVGKGVHNFGVRINIWETTGLLLLVLGVTVYYLLNKEYGHALLSTLGIVVVGAFLALEYSFLW